LETDQAPMRTPDRSGAPGSDAAGLGALALTYLHGLPYPALVLDTPDSTLRWANEAGEDFLVEGAALVRMGNRIVAADRSLQAGFNAFLTSSDEDGCWLMAAADGPPAFIIRKTTLGAPESHRPVMLFAYGPEHRARFLEPDLSPLWRLTPTEGRILRLLCAGHPAERITRLADITIETARTHIRRIYAKMGVGCREELFFAVGQYRVP